MTITEIAGMLDKAVTSVAEKKDALDKAKAERDAIVATADNNYSVAATQYDVALEEVNALKAQLNKALEGFNPSPRVR